jgi:hypothetical protein
MVERLETDANILAVHCLCLSCPSRPVMRSSTSMKKVSDVRTSRPDIRRVIIQ